MVQDTPSRKLDQYILRLPDGMRDKLKAEAEHNKRSLNAEIVARLELSLEHFHELSAIGMGQFVRRLEANIEASELMAFRLAAELRMAAGVISSDDEPIRAAIAKYAAANRMNLAVATQSILKDWLVSQGLLSPQQSGSMSEVQIAASADVVRSQAGDAADVAMVGMVATKEQKASRRRELTDEPAVVGKARAKGKSHSPHREDPEGAN